MSALSVIFAIIPAALVSLLLWAPTAKARWAFPLIMGAGILCTIAALPVDSQRAVADVMVQEMIGRAHAAPVVSSVVRG